MSDFNKTTGCEPSFRLLAIEERVIQIHTAMDQEKAHSLNWSKIVKDLEKKIKMFHLSSSYLTKDEMMN